MRWRKGQEPEPEPSSEISQELGAAVAARKEAEAELEKVKDTRREVDRIVHSLRELRKTDPLALLFVESLKSNRRHRRNEP